MKHIIISAVLSAATLISTGCSGFLDEEMKSTLGPDNTYISSYGFELAATGLYGWARSEFKVQAAGLQQMCFRRRRHFVGAIFRCRIDVQREQGGRG